MPLFPNVESNYTFGGKSHTNLVVSEGQAPSEKWIVSKAENANVKFQYPFGPEGNQAVVLAKGKIVELGETEFDAETSRQVTTIKQATVGSNRAVGVNHHNVYQKRRDRFSGNNQPNPTVLTRQYIEVPLFEHAVSATAAGMAKAMNFGAAYGTSNEIVAGDFVKVGEDGNFVKLDIAGGDTAFQIVGQALAVERELPPAGFLQYYLDLEIPQIEEFLKAQGHAPSPGQNGVDAGAYPAGYPYTNQGWLADFNKLLNPVINKGIPFLTDGYFAAKQTLTGILISDLYDASNNNDGHIERVDFSGQVEIGTFDAAANAGAGLFTPGAGGNDVRVAADSRNNALFIKLRHPIDKAEADAVVVKHAGGTVAGTDVHVDYNNNVVVVYLEAGAVMNDIAIDAKLVVDPKAGVPTEWDYAGSVGAVRILLQR